MVHGIMCIASYSKLDCFAFEELDVDHDRRSKSKTQEIYPTLQKREKSLNYVRDVPNRRSKRSLSEKRAVAFPFSVSPFSE